MVPPGRPVLVPQTFFWEARTLTTDRATQITARTSSPPQRTPIAPQAGWADTADRPIWTTQLSGLRDAMACIQPGISCVCMNAEDRNISGSMKNVYTPMIASRDLSSMPVMLDRAPNTTPTSIDAATITTTPATPP